MLPPLVVYVFTALAAGVVVVTRARPSTGSRGPGTVHTVAGVLAIVLWLTFLLDSERLGEDAITLIGLVALVCWWITVVAGLLILLRRLPARARARGRHAGPGAAASTSGPALSVLGHVGLLVAVGVLTYAYPTW